MRRAANRLKLAVLAAVCLSLHGHAFATSRLPLAVYQVDQRARGALRNADLVIEGNVAGMDSERMENIERLPGQPNFFSMYRVYQVDVEKVWKGFYFGASIRVVDRELYDPMKFNAGGRVVFSATFNPDAKRYVINRDACFVYGEKHRWWSQTPGQVTPLPYKTRELLAFTKGR